MSSYSDSGATTLYTVQTLDEVHEKLKRLNYEEHFVVKQHQSFFMKDLFYRGSTLLSDSSNNNSSLQFQYVIDLIRWLFSLILNSSNETHTTTTTVQFNIDNYDDPNTITHKIFTTLRDVGFADPNNKKLNNKMHHKVTAAKLKIPYGEHIATVLDFLTDMALQKKDEETMMDSDVVIYHDSILNKKTNEKEKFYDNNNNDDDDDAFVREESVSPTGSFSTAYSSSTFSSTDDDNSSMFPTNHVDSEAIIKKSSIAFFLKSITVNSMIHSQRTKPDDLLEWENEVERVAPKLLLLQQRKASLLSIATISNKENAIGSNGRKRKWRQTLFQIQTLLKTLKNEVHPEICTNVMDPLTTEMKHCLDQIIMKEELLNNGDEQFFGHLVREFQEAKSKLKETEDSYNISNQNVIELTNTLSSITQELNEVKTLMNEKTKGDVGTNTRARKQNVITRMKNAIQHIKLDIQEFDMRIGVATYLLLSKTQEGAKFKRNTITVDEEDDDSISST
eukprot:CAMPEP_0178980990 /NCGR_PEP_ID=MMETSP0789-20121207/26808_1 /TAXON_ID=3005 /ORGANISM="Rhizosolenia setigera, Strain CCMP 1694" /LENGTH=504 /DNA_ID=CAMNT_0020671475 /DNA_START=161 /DNA_END=1671 /DNA_ORIENTATION=+